MGEHRTAGRKVSEDSISASQFPPILVLYSHIYRQRRLAAHSIPSVRQCYLKPGEISHHYQIRTFFGKNLQECATTTAEYATPHSGSQGRYWVWAFCGSAIFKRLPVPISAVTRYDFVAAIAWGLQSRPRGYLFQLAILIIESPHQSYRKDS